MMEIVIKQNTKDWLLIRRGPKKIRIGGSEIGTICGVNNIAFPYSLFEKIIQELYGIWEEDSEEPEPCKHGHLCEPIIANLYEKVTHNKVEEANYWIQEDEYLSILYGCSPDRKVYINGKFEGLLEIKAPYYQ